MQSLRRPQSGRRPVPIEARAAAPAADAMKRAGVALCLFLAAGWAAAQQAPAQQASSKPPERPRVPATVRIDPALAPSDRNGPLRDLDAVRDEAGVRTAFRKNQVIVRPASRAELDGFLRKYRGRVLSTDAVPAPPPEARIEMDPKYLKPTAWVVLIDPPAIRLEELAARITRAGGSGEHAVSSASAAALAGVALAETAAGRHVGLNYVSDLHAVLFSTNEGNGVNGFTIKGYDDKGSKSEVAKAWQFLTAHGFARRVKVAIIDTGFWLDGAGKPFPNADIPATPFLYDFTDNDRIPNGPSNCGNASCAWHGTNVASVAFGIMNNGRGGAGTGSLVADAMYFKFDRSEGQELSAVRTATAWGADVINESFGKHCGWFCRMDREGVFYSGYALPITTGKIIVAAAGNDGIDALDEHIQPCQISGVLCVGAIDNGTNTSSYSNWGDTLGIWAPDNILVGSDGGNMTGTSVFGGTSASTPFTAGIVAMMKAINPGLFQTHIHGMLHDASWKDSPDGHVQGKGYIDAYRSLLLAADNTMAPDRFEPNSNPSAATVLGGGNQPNLTIHRANTPAGAPVAWDTDYYRFTLTNFGTIQLRLTYMPQLAYYFIDIFPGGNTCSTLDTSRTDVQDGTNVTYSGLGPGDYIIAVRANGPSAYDMNVTLTAAGLPADAFEPNETAAAAHAITPGTFDANLQTAGDADWYSFTVTSSPVTAPFTVDLTSTCAPVSVRLIHDGVDDGGGIPSKSHFLTLQTGSYKMGVTGQAATPYHFLAKNRRAKVFDRLWEEVEIFRYDPGDPGPRWLSGPRELIAITKTEAFRSLRIRGGGLRAILMDLDGKTIATASMDPRTGELVLPFDGARNGMEYIVRVTREADRLEGGASTALRYEVKAER